jgi:hypothetical protein
MISGIDCQDDIMFAQAACLLVTNAFGGLDQYGSFADAMSLEIQDKFFE